MRTAAVPSALGTGLAGASATFVGVGLGRFAYTPMIPAMVEADWFSAPQTAYLGAANLLGYLIGAVASDPLARRFGVQRVILAAFLVVTVSFVMCAGPLPYYWVAGWRLAAGVGGAILMVVGGSTAMTSIPGPRRAREGALVFTGVGLGILATAVAIPVLLRWSVSGTWLGIALVAALATAGTWHSWIRLGRSSGAGTAAPPPAHSSASMFSLAVVLTLGAYALEAVGFIPHTVFWVDYLARERALGMDVASIHWAIFGLGATAGALTGGELARRLGWRRGLATALLVKAIAVALPLVSESVVGLALSSVVVGALVPGMVVLASGRFAELVGPGQHRRVWGYGTAAFAASQAMAGYGYAALFSIAESYRPHFAIAAVGLLLGAILATSGRRNT